MIDLFVVFHQRLLPPLYLIFFAKTTEGVTLTDLDSWETKIYRQFVL